METDLIKRDDNMADTIYSKDLLSSKHRKNRIEVFCYRGHIAIKIHRIKYIYIERNNSQSFPGLYFSFGGPGNGDYINGLEEDKKYYGKPVRFFIDLPKNMTYEKLSKVCALSTKEYSFFRNNCADGTLKLLRDTLGFTEIAHVKTRLTTTPQYIAKKALVIKKSQLDKKIVSLTNHRIQLKNDLRDNPDDINNPNYTNQMLQDWRKLLTYEREKLKIQSKELELDAKALSWGSLKFPAKIFKNIMLSVRLNLIKAKVNYLKKIEADIEKTTDPEFKHHPDPFEVQRIFEKMNRSYILRKHFKKCIEDFPVVLLPGEDRKRQFLISIYEKIKERERDQRKNRFFGKGLPKGIEALYNKLKVIDKSLFLRYENEDIQKLFIEIQVMLQEKNHKVSSSQKGFEATFYKEWYLNSLKWKDIQVERPRPVVLSRK